MHEQQLDTGARLPVHEDAGTAFWHGAPVSAGDAPERNRARLNHDFALRIFPSHDLIRKVPQLFEIMR
jgi:hypothetical protein